MARTPQQRGPFGRWLKRVREDRYVTQAQAVAELRRLGGIAISPSEFAQWEAGSRVPRPDNPKVARLYEFFGSQPDAESDLPPADMAALIAALEAQTKAISQLVERFDALASVAIREGVADALREAESRQAAGGSPLAPPLEQPA